ncbi:MAG TPA: hypothetical protein PKO28_03790 [Bacilli bacterium]|nr:hypothetical protein [Bacilli bacterium]HPS18662.1 hypothetical protein [Bacilli bacterium]
MPKIYSKYQKLHRKYLNRTKSMFDEKNGRDILAAISRGKNSYLRMDRYESSFMDLSWIKEVEDCIPELEQIVNNPRRVIATVSDVVAVEKAKKTTNESVIHLASHTQYVKEVKEEGEVVPSKILNIYNEDYFIIYENKFIATLIRHLLSFVEKRYQYIINFAPLKDAEILYMKNSSIVDGCEVEMETKIKVTKPTIDDYSEKSKVFLTRIEEVRKHLRFFANSEFMRLLRNERDVRNPILQTNIIRKNPLYRKCYQLWIFLEKYVKSGIDVKVEERISQLSNKDLKELNEVFFANFISLKGKDPSKTPLNQKIKTYAPRILNTLDDEVYIFGPYYDDPIEFIRVDQKYLDFINRPIEVDPHPTKAIAEYDKDKYDKNKEIREKAKEIEALKKRREAEARAYLKQTQELLEKQKREAIETKRQAELEVQKAELKRLEDARQILADMAKEDNIDFSIEDSQPDIETADGKQVFTKTIEIPMDESSSETDVLEKPEETTIYGEASMKMEQTVEVTTTLAPQEEDDAKDEIETEEKER